MTPPAAPPERPAALVIRDARPDEHAALGRLMTEVYAGLDGFPGPAEQPAYYALLADVGRLAAEPDTRLLVAARGGELAGGVVYIGDLARYGAGGAATRVPAASGFRLLAVRPAARGAGVGRALATRCIELARARGHREVVLHTTRAMTVAWGMYERLGFARAPELDFVQGELPVFGFRLDLRA